MKYIRGPIKIETSIPAGYKEHLDVLEETLGEKGAPYFGPDLEDNCTKTALELWEGFRSMEEYAREIFPLEEDANGLTWMDEAETPKKEVDHDFGAKTF